MIIVVGGTKGGTGKSTIVMNLSAIDVINGNDSLLVDADRQGSASMWAETRNQSDRELRHVPTVQRYGKSIGQELKGLGDKYTHVFVDAGGYDSLELRSTLVIADKLIIPVRPSQVDIWTLPKIIEIAQGAIIYNSNLRFWFVINGAHSNPQVKDASDVLELLEGMPVCRSIIHHRRAYTKAPVMGMAVTEMQGRDRDPKAVDEILGLYAEIVTSE